MANYIAIRGFFKQNNGSVFCKNCATDLRGGAFSPSYVAAWTLDTTDGYVRSYSYVCCIYYISSYIILLLL